MKKLLCIAAIITLAACTTSRNGPGEAIMALTTDNGLGVEIGKVVFTDTDKGLKIKVDLKDLPEGAHGFHVHEFGDCSPVAKDRAMAAGGHYDPNNTGKHLGPEGGGHKGDLPRLIVNEKGNVKTEFYVRGVYATELKDRALMVHAGGDNYKDAPKPLGGGGARIACGVIK